MDGVERPWCTPGVTRRRREAHGIVESRMQELACQLTPSANCHAYHAPAEVEQQAAQRESSAPWWS
jgi:hypothetical protein